MVLCLIWYYQNIWDNSNEVIVPLIDLVGKSGHIKVTKKKGTKKLTNIWENEKTYCL